MTTEGWAIAVGLALAACAPRPPVAVVAPRASAAPAVSSAPGGDAAPRSVGVRVADHLGFGLRLESLSVHVDGRPVTRDASAVGSERHPASATGDLGSIAIGPGVHDVSVVARVSIACGLLSGPRASVTVRVSDGFRVGTGVENAAWVGIDVFARAPTVRPSEMPALGLAGHGVVLGLKGAEAPSGPVHPACAGLSEVAAAACDIEAKVEEARKAADTRAEACGATRLAEIHSLRGVLDAATSRMSAEGTTNETAMHAQLRALYAESRIRALAAETARCMKDDGAAQDLPIERACPDEGVALGP